MRVIGMERWLEEQRRTHVDGTCLTQYAVRGHSTRLLQMSDTNQRQVCASSLQVKPDAQTVQRRVSATVVDTTTQHCKLEPWLRRPQLTSELRTAHGPSWLRERVGADLAGRDPGVEKVPLTVSSEQLRKTGRKVGI